MLSGAEIKEIARVIRYKIAGIFGIEWCLGK